MVCLLGLIPGAHATQGYVSDLGKSPRRLVALNGDPVLNMDALARAVVAATPATGPSVARRRRGGNGGDGGDPEHVLEPEFLRFEFDDGSVVVLELAHVASDTGHLLAEQSIR